MAPKLQIEVVYATPTQQNTVNIAMEQGSTIRQAVVAAKLYNGEIENLSVGIFGKLRSLDFELQDGDRVEIYSALLIDPKQARRDRAKEEKKKRRKT